MNMLSASKRVKRIVRRLPWSHILMGLPLGGAVAASFFPLARASQQFLVLVVLVWVQVFVIFEVLVLGH